MTETLERRVLSGWCLPAAEGRTHPERACYLLGAEDHGLPVSVLDRCHEIVQIESALPQSHNVAVAGALVLHHRHTTRTGVLA